MTTDPKPAEPREPVTVKSPKGPFDSSAIVVDTSGSLEHLAVLLHERFRPLAGDVLIFDDCEQIAQMAVVALKHDERAAYDRGLAEGRRQATEGWERQWGYVVPGRKPFRCDNEAEAREAALYAEVVSVVSRLTGQWEPADPITPEVYAKYFPERGDDGKPLVEPEVYDSHLDPATGHWVPTTPARQIPDDEPGCPTCRTILNAKAAGCDDPWHADNRPASGGVVEPSGPLTAEEATPVVSIEPDPMLHGHNDGSGLDHGCPECQLKLAAVAARVRAAYGMPAEETRPIDGIKVISNRPRMTDGCGPEHTYRGTCEYAHWAKEAK